MRIRGGGGGGGGGVSPVLTRDALIFPGQDDVPAFSFQTTLPGPCKCCGRPRGAPFGGPVGTVMLNPDATARPHQPGVYSSGLLISLRFGRMALVCFGAELKLNINHVGLLILNPTRVADSSKDCQQDFWDDRQTLQLSSIQKASFEGNPLPVHSQTRGLFAQPLAPSLVGFKKSINRCRTYPAKKANGRRRTLASICLRIFPCWF